MRSRTDRTDSIGVFACNKSSQPREPINGDNVSRKKKKKKEFDRHNVKNDDKKRFISRLSMGIAIFHTERVIGCNIFAVIIRAHVCGYFLFFFFSLVRLPTLVSRSTLRVISLRLRINAKTTTRLQLL